MVAQHVFPPQTSSEQTLGTVWRATAQRISGRHAFLLLTLGLGGVTARVITGRFTMLASVGILMAAFACYAVITHGAERGRPSRVTRVLAGTMKLVAAMAGVATALLLLAIVFGGSLEVMRH